MDSPTSETLQIVVNGAARMAPSGLTVSSLLEFLEIQPDRVAVELNRKIIRQPEWETAPVEDGAAVEIVQFVGGG